MGSFQAKIVRGRPRKTENKSYRSVSFYAALNRKLKKIAKKFNKVKNSIMASFPAKIGWKRPRKRKNKNCLSVPFLPGRQ